MNEAARRELVTRVQFAAQKLRSNAFEPGLGWFDESDPVARRCFYDLARRLDPDDPLNLIDVTAAVLAKSEVERIDVFNVLTLAHQNEVLLFQFAVLEEVDLPRPMEVWA